MSSQLNYKKIFNKGNNQNINLKTNQDIQKNIQKNIQNQEKNNNDILLDEIKININDSKQILNTSNISNTFDATQKNYSQWADFFHTNGYIIITNAIEPNQIAKLKEELALAETKNKFKKIDLDRHLVHKCFFENSPTTLNLIESSVLYDFAQHMIADVPGGRGNTLTAHLIHNNAFIVPPGGRGQAPTYHTDDCLQNVIIPEGKELPEWVKLPVLACTWMCWLSDCVNPENGPTWVVPGSHRFGRTVDPDLASQLAIPVCGKAGTCVLINNQIWHRGSANTSNIPRHTLQLTFARRIIGHKHKTIMNYHMPEHVYKNKSDKLKERLGWLQGGAYS